MGGGNDHIISFFGDDTLKGYGGDDIITGQLGADTFYGGVGKDYMYSGGSDGDKDTFIFENVTESAIGSGDDFDRIVGFEVGVDEINLAALGVQSASVALRSGNVYDVTVSGSADFEIVVTTTGGDTLSLSDIVIA